MPDLSQGGVSRPRGVGRRADEIKVGDLIRRGRGFSFRRVRAVLRDGQFVWFGYMNDYGLHYGNERSLPDTKWLVYDTPPRGRSV